MFGYLAILQIMSRRTGFKGDRGKAPIYATSYGDDSSDDDHFGWRAGGLGSKATLTTGVMNPGPPAVYLWRPDLRGHV